MLTVLTLCNQQQVIENGFRKKSHFPANNATSDLKEQSDRSSIYFCVHLLIHPKKEKANTGKEMELSFNYQGMAWTVHHH